MCELDVYVKRFDSNAKVASEIIYAGAEGGALVLRDIVGSTTKLEDTIISGIDINHERMELTESPLLSSVVKFIETYENCLSKGEYASDLQDRWDVVKDRGDQMVRALWARSEKVKAH